MRHYSPPKGFIQGGKLKRDALATGHHKYCSSGAACINQDTLVNYKLTGIFLTNLRFVDNIRTTDNMSVRVCHELKLTGIFLTNHRFVDNIRADNISVQVSFVNYKLTGIFFKNHRFVDNIRKDIRLWPFILAGLCTYTCLSPVHPWQWY